MNDFPPSLLLMGTIGAALGLLVLFIVAVIKAFTQKTKGWIATAIACVVLGVVCLGIMASQVAGMIGKMSARSKLIEKTLVAKDDRFTVRVPNGWSNLPTLNFEADLGAGNALLEQYLLLFVEKKTDLDMSLDDFSKVSAGQTRDRLQDGVMEDPEPIKLGKLNGVQRRISGSSDGVKVVFLHTSVETNDSLVQLLCWTLPSKVDTAFPVFQQVIQTFEAKPGKVEIEAHRPVEMTPAPEQ